MNINRYKKNNYLQDLTGALKFGKTFITSKSLRSI